MGRRGGPLERKAEADGEEEEDSQGLEQDTAGCSGVCRCISRHVYLYVYVCVKLLHMWKSSCGCGWSVVWPTD